MEPVAPNRNLSRWGEMKHAVVNPADVYRILRAWKDNDAFDVDHIAAIARDVARTLSDNLETPVDGEILYFDYTDTSYQDCDTLFALYGDRIVTINEMRNDNGWLKQYRVVLKSKEI
jgi:hypothetical protein